MMNYNTSCFTLKTSNVVYFIAGLIAGCQSLENNFPERCTVSIFLLLLWSLHKAHKQVAECPPMKKTFFILMAFSGYNKLRNRQKYKQKENMRKTKQYCSGENHSLGLIPYQMLGEYLPIISKSKTEGNEHIKNINLSITEF